MTLTVSEGKQNARRGSTAVHDKNADRVARKLASHLEETLSTTVVAYAALLKYGEQARGVLPRFTFDFNEPRTFGELLEYIKATGGRGPISMRAFHSRYGIPEPGDEADDLSRLIAGGGPAGDAGDGATATFTYPAEEQARFEEVTHTFRRDLAIKTRFVALRKEGATVDEALGVLETEYPLSRGSLRNIVYSP